MEYTCLDGDSPGHNRSDARALTHRWRFKRRRQVDYPKPCMTSRKGDSMRPTGVEPAHLTVGKSSPT